MKPDLIIAGAMRAGTTALAAALARHPEIMVTEPKEPNFFATLHGALDYTGPGDKWFASQNTADWTRYQSLFDERASVACEASAMYLALPETARSIADQLPDCRIAIILRDPLERAMSAHSYLRSKGREPEPEFVKALSLERGRKDRGFGPMWWLSGASDYAPGLRAYFEAFGHDRIHVILNEDLKRDPHSALTDLYRFLGVAPSSGPAEFLTRANVNAGGVPKGRTMTKLLYPPDSVRRVLRRLAPESARQVVRDARKSSVVAASFSDAGLPDEVKRRFSEFASATGSVLERGLTDVWPSARGTG